MKVYINNTFEGAYPVPTAAVVVAENKKSAAQILSESLKRADLTQKITPESMVEIDISQPNTYLLAVGEW